VLHAFAWIEVSWDLNSVIASFLNALLFAKLCRYDKIKNLQKKPYAAGEPVSRRGGAGTIMMLLRGDVAVSVLC
jgi:hypothetical protein